MTSFINPTALKIWDNVPSEFPADASEDEDEIDPLAQMNEDQVRFPIDRELNKKIILWFVLK